MELTLFRMEVRGALIRTSGPANIGDRPKWDSHDRESRWYGRKLITSEVIDKQQQRFDVYKPWIEMGDSELNYFA
jgi:hypothetical protein